MTQFINICLEQPRKLERIITLLLKTLITIWLLNLVLVKVEPNIFDEWSTTEDYISFKFLGDFSPITCALYVVFFIVSWVLLWEIFAFKILPFLGKIIQLLLQVVALIALLIVGLLKILWQRLIREPKLIINEESETTEFLREQNRDNSVKFFFGSLYIFHAMNVRSKGVVGSELLQLIIEHEEADFVKSRMMTYSAILVYVTFGIYTLRPEYSNLYFSIWLFILCMLVVFLGLVREVYRDLDNANLYELRTKLKRDLYSNMVDETIKDHNISEGYKLESLRKRLVLSRKDSDFKINIIRMSSDQRELPLTKDLEHLRYNLSDETQNIVVSNMIPDLAAQNFFSTSNIYFIYAKSQEELYEGLNKINRLIKSNRDGNKI